MGNRGLADEYGTLGIEERYQTGAGRSVKMKIGKDEWTGTFKALAANSTPAMKTRILTEVADDMKWTTRKNIQNELQYDGAPMKSPAKVTKFGDRFSIDYNWRYLKTIRHMDSKEKKQFKTTGRVGGGAGRKIIKGETGADKVQGRVAVTAASKQLNFTGATIKSIDIISVSSNKAIVGPTTGHGRTILSIHNPTRRPAGISKAFAEKIAKMVLTRLTKGV